MVQRQDPSEQEEEKEEKVKLFKLGQWKRK